MTSASPIRPTLIHAHAAAAALEQSPPALAMTLPVAEFIRRFLIHVLPSGFHRIRHYGLLASGARAHNIARVR